MRASHDGATADAFIEWPGVIARLETERFGQF
jgi:hypothetical protein